MRRSALALMGCLLLAVAGCCCGHRCGGGKWRDSCDGYGACGCYDNCVSGCSCGCDGCGYDACSCGNCPTGCDSWALPTYSSYGQCCPTTISGCDPCCHGGIAPTSCCHHGATGGVIQQGTTGVPFDSNCPHCGTALNGPAINGTVIGGPVVPQEGAIFDSSWNLISQPAAIGTPTGPSPLVPGSSTPIQPATPTPATANR